MVQDFPHPNTWPLLLALAPRSLPGTQRGASGQKLYSVRQGDLRVFLFGSPMDTAHNLLEVFFKCICM